MLTLKNNKLTNTPFIIDSNEFIFSLSTDIDCEFFGLITLNNNVIKTVQFSKYDSLYKARLLITKEDIDNLVGSTLHIVSMSSNFTQESNKINLLFNNLVINNKVKESTSLELFELKKQITTLTQKLNSMASGKIITNINISNKDYIQPGMVLVALDSKNFIAAYPFADTIKEVNGQKAIDGVVNLKASMIKYTTERTIAEQLEVLTTALLKEHKAIESISEEVKILSQKLADLSFKFEKHLDSGIV